MRLIKLALISAFVLFGILALIASLLPSQVRISRAVDINAPKEKVLMHLYYLPAWRQWNKFIDSLPILQMDNDYFKNDKLELSIVHRTDSIIKASWKQPGGRVFESGYQLLQPALEEGRFTVQWHFDFKLRWYPWEKFQSILYDQQLGPVMEQSLATLKKKLEE
jgi:hypothetical protein